MFVCIHHDSFSFIFIIRICPVRSSVSDLNPPPEFNDPVMMGNRKGLPLHFLLMVCRGKACPYPLLIAFLIILLYLGGGCGVTCSFDKPDIFMI